MSWFVFADGVTHNSWESEKTCDSAGERTGLRYGRGTAKGAGKTKGRGGLCPKPIPWRI